jgi:hypothetical protein
MLFADFLTAGHNQFGHAGIDEPLERKQQCAKDNSDTEQYQKSLLKRKTVNIELHLEPLDYTPRKIFL